MKKVGITGGIGSGKTTVSRVFKMLGIPVFNADVEARKLQENDPVLIANMQALLGSSCFTADGKLDRKATASSVFQNPELLTELNSIVHPAVAKAFNLWVAQQSAPFVLREAAIMIESGAHHDLDALIVVTAPQEVRINRVIKRDNSTQAQVRERINRQMSEGDRLTYADFVVINDDQTLILPQILDIYNKLIAYEGAEYGANPSA